MITLKVHGTFEWIKKKKNKIQPYAAYKRLTLDLKIRHRQIENEGIKKDISSKQKPSPPKAVVAILRSEK